MHGAFPKLVNNHEMLVTVINKKTEIFISLIFMISVYVEYFSFIIPLLAMPGTTEQYSASRMYATLPFSMLSLCCHYTLIRYLYFLETLSFLFYYRTLLCELSSSNLLINDPFSASWVPSLH